jgi:hypothetical protein
MTLNIVKHLNEMVIENDIAKRKELFDKIVDEIMDKPEKKELEIPSFIGKKGA